MDEGYGVGYDEGKADAERSCAVDRIRDLEAEVEGLELSMLDDAIEQATVNQHIRELEVALNTARPYVVDAHCDAQERLRKYQEYPMLRRREEHNVGCIKRDLDAIDAALKERE